MFPRIAEFGPVVLYTYGLLMSLGFLAGILWTVRMAKREGFHSDVIWGIGLLVMVSAVIGAKVLLVLFELNYYLDHPAEILTLDTLRSGGVFLGGLIAAVGSAILYFRIRRLPGWKLADCFAPGIALGHAIGRLGCFAAGCCYGDVCRLPWAVTFTDPLAHQIVGVPLNLPLHPTQLYEFLAEMILFAVLVWRSRWKRFDGQLILTYTFCYAVVRFFLDFFRHANSGTRWEGVATYSQLLCLAAIPIVFWLYRRLGNRPTSVPSRSKR